MAKLAPKVAKNLRSKLRKRLASRFLNLLLKFFATFGANLAMVDVAFVLRLWCAPQLVLKACGVKEISLTYFVDDHVPGQRKTSTSWYATYMQVSKYATPTSENKVASPAPRPPKVQCWMKKYTKARFKHRPFRIDVSMFWIDSTLYFGGRGERHFRFAFRIFRSTLWVCVTKLGQNAVSQMRLTLGNWLSQTVS